MILCRLCPTCPFRPGKERLGWEPGARRPLPGAVRSFAELDQRAAGAPNWNDEEETP